MTFCRSIIVKMATAVFGFNAFLTALLQILTYASPGKRACAISGTKSTGANSPENNMRGREGRVPKGRQPREK